MKIFLIGFACLVFACCKEEHPRLHYQISVTKYLSGYKSPLDGFEKPGLSFNVLESFLIDSGNFYYDDHRSGSRLVYLKKLQDQDIRFINQLLDTVNWSALEPKPCSNCLYHGPYYTLIKKTGNVETLFHLHRPTKAIEQLFKYGDSVQSEKKYFITDKKRIKAIDLKVFNDVAKRWKPLLRDEETKFTPPE